MTNGRGAGMASFMTKKKKYKFQVEICLEELLEVPFVSAVLFAKLRLLDGGNFQDHSSRQEVQDHKVHWNANFTFPCKMMANASTGVMERCVLRISIRKESKGGRSFNKLGFVDLNLAEYAGAGMIHKKALLEGYDTRHRQDNSMLKFKIQLNMISGDILFKAPSPSLKHKPVNVEETGPEQRSDEFSSGSLAGSIASGSSGFGSLPKKRPALLSSELVIGQTLTENNAQVSIAPDATNESHPVSSLPSALPHLDHEPQEIALGEPGHSRNSSNTSQLSKASGYSSIHSHSHSRQSSSGDSGHIRNLHSRSVRANNKPLNNFKLNTYPKKINIPNTIHSPNCRAFAASLPKNIATSTPSKDVPDGELNSMYGTPRSYQSQLSYSSADEYKTPEVSFNHRSDVFSQNFIELQKSSSTSVVERMKNNMLTVEDIQHRKSDTTSDREPTTDNRLSLKEIEKNRRNQEGVLRSKSEFEIPRMPVQPPPEKSFSSKLFSSESLFSFLTPRPKRKSISENNSPQQRHSPPNLFKVPNPLLKSLPETRTTSLSSLRSGHSANDGLSVQPVKRNPSAGSLVISETGSLDRAKAAYERRKKNQNQDSDAVGIPGRVEITRVNPDDLIEELLKNTNLEQPDDSAETSGLQLFIAKDGTAALGNHEVKSQMSTGVQGFKQVVMDNR
ncbi:uncharacterized protein LOC126884831 isoform X1 [Diabrotica virgifera virgifera]|uniref:C2 NT-type domain-containing protein n=2 Tax=Diabrotica virgifera virgifera TaxID=50390 RepID=A0ABM5KA36_DIAVI|nr:uncharacterized protein LOC126884831 isoform X1 [Diabrotica virgifera virgifera]